MTLAARLSTAVLLTAFAAAPVWAQQLQRPTVQPTPTQSTPTTQQTVPSAVPATPAERARSAGAIPETGPSTPMRPEPAAQPVPARPMTPTPVRDAQGRVVPEAQRTGPDRARDPLTGREFQTQPTPPARP